MNNQDQTNWFQDVETIISEPLNFKSKLAIGEFSIRRLARTLAEFTRENRDCNFKIMSQEILGFLNNIVALDGQLDQRQVFIMQTIPVSDPEEWVGKIDGF